MWVAYGAVDARDLVWVGAVIAVAYSLGFRRRRILATRTLPQADFNNR